MADIGSFSKLTNLWPARPSQPIDKFVVRKQTGKKQNKQNKGQQQSQSGKQKEEGPGKNIDEYA